ncbi:hypothetical protein EHI44_30545 [Rhizobium leguminosarum]|nr:hypothetical protein [Rhizobium leguminosarum]RWY79935.1 hypothetical protein EHI44_30545 [Rhizobium leguminosarum]
MNRFGGSTRAEVFVFEEDLEGIDLASPQRARKEAVAAAREIVAERIRRGDQADGATFEMMTEEGPLVATVPFRSEWA